MTFARALRELRESRNLLPVDVASRSGLHVRTIERLEAGSIKNPSIQTLITSADVYGWDLLTLLKRLDGGTR